MSTILECTGKKYTGLQSCVSSYKGAIIFYQERGVCLFVGGTRICCDGQREGLSQSVKGGDQNVFTVKKGGTIFSLEAKGRPEFFPIGNGGTDLWGLPLYCSSPISLSLLLN